ncbi:hypothetical protein CC2G_014840 [Coprinopsis cinerea AmutBmut pab1-1]|nr:hypothetical protein CC2G_014840 [Coprinopsis cinerea AmutBmut pab1-1]
MQKDVSTLEAFYNMVQSHWSDIEARNGGWMDWAPEISVDHYTKDIATFEVDADKISAHYKGNVVDLGAKYTLPQLVNKFYPPQQQQARLQVPD